MISEVHEWQEPLLCLFMPQGGQQYYEWHDWCELIEDIEKWQDLRDHLLAVDPAEHGEVLERAQSIARSVNARLACIAAVGDLDEKR